MTLETMPEGPHGNFIGCIRPALRAAGCDWPVENLQAFLGPAFTFSMQRDGGNVWQAGNYEWFYFFPMLNHFGDGIQVLSGSLKGSNPVTPEAFKALKEQAWQDIRKSIDEGIPAVIWSAMTEAQRLTGKHPLPFMWSIVVGCNDGDGTYTVRHSGAGEITIRWNALGHADPVNWFCAILIRRGARLQNEKIAHRAVLDHAIRSSKGEFPGGEAPAHGIAAWKLWLKTFEKGKVNRGAAESHANFLIQSRGAAAAYLRSVGASLGSNAQKPALDASLLYEELAQTLRQFSVCCSNDAPDDKKATELLSIALEKELKAIEKLRETLAAN